MAEREGKVAGRTRDGRMATLTQEAEKEFDLKQQENLSSNKTKLEVNSPKNKLEAARQYTKQMHADLREKNRHLIERLQEIGQTVTTKYEFATKEKIFIFLSGLGIKSAKDWAYRSRLQRLETLSIDELVKEIDQLTGSTISELESAEKICANNVTSYNEALKDNLKTLAKNQPLLTRAQAEREELQARVEGLKNVLEANAFDVSERPQKEALYEEAQKELIKIVEQETDYLHAVTRSKEANELLQKARNTDSSIKQALHQMQRDLFEMHRGLRSILQNAPNNVRVQSKIEMYQDVAPVYRDTVERLLEHGVRVAGAAVEVAGNQVGQRAVGREKFIALMRDLHQSTSSFLQKFDELVEDAEKGGRVVLPHEEVEEVLNSLPGGNGDGNSDDNGDGEVVISHAIANEPPTA